MASLRLRQFLMVVGICLVVAQVSSKSDKEYNPLCTPKGPTDSAEDNRNDCRTNMERIFNGARDLLKTSDLKNFNIKNPDPCETCQVRGVQEFKFINVSEVFVKKCGNKTCIDQVLLLEIPKIEATCTCTMHKDPKKSIDQMTAVVQKENFGIECDAPDGVKANLPKPPIPSGFSNPQDLLKLQSCSPVALPGAKVPGIGKRNSEDTVTGIVNANWDKIVLKLTIRACDEQGYVVMAAAALVDPNVDAIKLTCEGEESFMKPCNCMLEAKFMNALIFQGIQIAFPCYCDAATVKQKDNVNKITCAEYYSLKKPKNA